MYEHMISSRNDGRFHQRPTPGNRGSVLTALEEFQNTTLHHPIASRPIALPPLASIAYQEKKHYHTPPKDSVRYDILPNGQKVIRKCGDCTSIYTAGHWCTDTYVQGGYICQKCYRRRKKSLGSIPTRSCFECKSDTTKQVWYKHMIEIDQYLCDVCNIRLNGTTMDTNKKRKAEEIFAIPSSVVRAGVSPNSRSLVPISSLQTQNRRLNESVPPFIGQYRRREYQTPPPRIQSTPPRLPPLSTVVKLGDLQAFNQKPSIQPNPEFPPLHAYLRKRHRSI